MQKHMSYRRLFTGHGTTVLSLLVLLSLVGCSRSGGGGYNPRIDPANFVVAVDNPYYPLVPGTRYLYEAETDEGTERVEVYVTHETIEIMGVTCTVVRDTETLDGELVEDTFDWFAQDIDGTVWYFGEDSREYEDGEVVSTEGSWEAGVDGAKPGIVMQGDPQVGDTYRQEYYRGEAEDKGRVLSLSESVDVPYGLFDDCIETEDFTRLEPGVVEQKFYAPGIGNVLTIEEDALVELVSLVPGDYEPVINAADFVGVVDNPYYPLVPGTRYLYEAETDEGTERVEVYVSHETIEIMGVTCTVVRDTETLDGELVEDTFDWFAQDIDGNVWYFGEDSSEYEDGEVVSTEGSWEAGVDGAKPGIIMQGDPQVGDTYRQEYYAGEAEDMGTVLSLTESVDVSYGSFDDCIATDDFTPLEPGVFEQKFYAYGIGNVLTIEEDFAVELISFVPGDYDPVINPADFVGVVDNPYYPLVPGTRYLYEAETDEGTERVEVYVTHEIIEIMGVTCTVVRDTVTVDGELVEDTFDWFAQDIDGNVWYFGEDSREYEDGEVVSMEGSWEAGVDGAKPGIVMEGDPQVGDTYRQEYYAGEAEDMGTVLSLTESVDVPYGSFDNCIATDDFTPLEPGIVEQKFYAPGIGNVLTIEEDLLVELVSVTAE